LTPKQYSELIESIWKANEQNSQKVAKESMGRFPQPPIMKNLEIMSGNQFSKLLADLQKRSFFHGALAMALALDEANMVQKQ
jgi:hypothetical protein